MVISKVQREDYNHRFEQWHTMTALNKSVWFVNGHDSDGTHRLATREEGEVSIKERGQVKIKRSSGQLQSLLFVTLTKQTDDNGQSKRQLQSLASLWGDWVGHKSNGKWSGQGVCIHTLYWFSWKQIRLLCVLSLPYLMTSQGNGILILFCTFSVCACCYCLVFLFCFDLFVCLFVF